MVTAFAVIIAIFIEVASLWFHFRLCAGVVKPCSLFDLALKPNLSELVKTILKRCLVVSSSAFFLLSDFYPLPTANATVA
tara:strand:- start:811 stop:1050 length:240 start_codon:yes stop_codon:yes gene_type:complete